MRKLKGFLSVFAFSGLVQVGGFDSMKEKYLKSIPQARNTAILLDQGNSLRLLKFW